MSNIKYFNFNDDFQLESGKSLSGFQLAYQTFGKLNKEGSNVIWIVHALTANSDPIEWWPGVVGNGCAIDPDKHFIICANSLGSHYGSTNPLDIDLRSGTPYYHDFPLITNRDVANTFILLKEYLGLSKINTLVGASLGGQQALEWLIKEPYLFDRSVLIATNAKHSPWGIAFNESQRMAIEADQTWPSRRDDAGINGLKAARAIALLSYRTANGYNTTQEDEGQKTNDYKASSYQRYQGQKLTERFNAFSYWYLSKAMDSHDIGRNRGGLEAALSRVQAKTTVIGVQSDILFPTKEQRLIADYILDSKYYEIESNLGHDGFLTESKKIGLLVDQAVNSIEIDNPLLVPVGTSS